MRKSLDSEADIIVVGIQWYPYNDAIFIVVHPVVFLNKLVLEMSICDRMAQLSKIPQELDKNTISVLSIAPIFFPQASQDREHKALPETPESYNKIIELV